MKTIKEGEAKFYGETPNTVSRKMEVFYNPKMEENRDICIALLNSINKKNMRIALPLAGTGIRAIRMFKELNKDKIKIININDANVDACKLIKENLKLNKIENNFEIYNKQANEFLMENKGMDYIEIDPFGSPNPFLQDAIISLSRDAILAITATDTAALCGTYKNTCIRNYFAKPLREYIQHEVGIRILIRKVQLIAAQFDKALTPIFSYSKDHYMRVYFICKKQKSACDKVLEQHKELYYNPKTGEYSDKERFDRVAGPMWMGDLWDKKLVKKILKVLPNNKLIKLISEEMNFQPLYYDTHHLSKLNGVSHQPKMEGFVRTHFSLYAVKSKLKPKEFIEKVIKNNDF